MFARTKRLLLRPGWCEDAQALAQAMGDEAVVRNLARAPWPYGLEDAEGWLGRDGDPLLPEFLIFSRTRGAPRLVGGCGIDRCEGNALELGYWIARPYWGLGFATEAASALVRISRAIGLPKLTAGHMLDNPASAKVLRKIGFRPTGRIEQRFSAGRDATVPVALFEQGDDAAALMREDLAQELYKDRPAIAA